MSTFDSNDLGIVRKECKTCGTKVEERVEDVSRPLSREFLSSLHFLALMRSRTSPLLLSIVVID